MINILDKLRNKKLIQVNVTGCVLSMTAGWVNVVGINLFISESPVFLSGRGIELACLALKGDIIAFLNVALVVLFFIIGSVISTKITKQKGLSGGLFFVGILISIASLWVSLGIIIVDTITISMAMGAQNAATSLTPINRTTHLTGPATDLGINIANKNWKGAVFLALRWVSFIIGAIIGFAFIELYNNTTISLFMILLLPAIIILSMGFIQKKIMHIPLLEDTNNKGKQLNK